MSTIKLIIPEYYPTNCRLCPLLGIRPKDELQPGDKFTYKCMAFNKNLSGKGTLSPTARCRCGKRKYHRLNFRSQGEVRLDSKFASKYLIKEQILNFAPDYGKENKTDNGRRD